MSGARDDALQSALKRLGVAVFILNGTQVLEPYNRKASELFEQELLRGDLIVSRPSHPLAVYLKRLAAERSGDPPVETVEFPGGNRYRIEASRRSDKGAGRWYMLLVQPALRAAPITPRDLGQFSLTDREEEIVRLMVRGSASEEICSALSITVNTLKTHVRNILAKTATRNRTELMAKILRGS